MKAKKRQYLFLLLLLAIAVLCGALLIAGWAAPIDTSFGFDDSLNNGKEQLIAWGVEPELAKHISDSDILTGMLQADQIYCQKKWFDADSREFRQENHILIENGQARNAGESTDGDETIKDTAAAEDTLFLFVQSETGMVTAAKLRRQNEMPAVRLTDQIRFTADGLNFVTGSGYGLLVTEGENERGYQYLESSAEITEATATLRTEVPLPLTNQAERIYVVTAAQFQSSDPLYRQARTTITSSYQHNALFSDNFYNNSLFFSFDPTDLV